MTPEQTAAEDALHAAIEAHARAFDLPPDAGALLMSWVVVEVWLPQNSEDEDPTTGYATAYRGGSMPQHEIWGLAETLRRAAEWGAEP